MEASCNSGYIFLVIFVFMLRSAPCDNYYLLTIDKPGVVLQVYTSLNGIEDGYIEGVYKSTKFPGKPDRVDTRFNFDSSPSLEENIAQRLYGWFLPPLSGGYIFYTSCDDACDLFLSSNQQPALRLKLVSQKEWSNHNQFDK